jgi:hypothetical protein
MSILLGNACPIIAGIATKSFKSLQLHTEENIVEANTEQTYQSILIATNH